MKAIRVIAAVILLCVVSAVSYYVGKSQNNECYEDACRMSALIKCYEGHLDEDSTIEDYGCFEELEGVFLYDNSLGKPVNLGKYSFSR